jgi:Gas vesicle synthesis protein GvpL/GvpF
MPYYLYGIINEDKNFKTIPKTGLNDEDVSAIHFKNVAAVVSKYQFTDKEYVVSTRKNMIAYQKTIEKVMEKQSILPFKFGTVVNDDELKVIFEERYDEFLKNLIKIQNKIELNLKGMWKDMPVIFENIRNSNPSIQKLIRQMEANNHKNIQSILIEVGQLVEQDLKRNKVLLTDEITAVLKAHCLDFKINDTQTDPMFMNVAFLVDKSKEKHFDESIKQIGIKYDAVANFKYVGPLAPFNFIG